MTRGVALAPEARAEALLRKHRVTSAPVPVDDIAKAEGGIVVRKAHDGPDLGFVYRDGGRVVIGVNSSSGRQPRQRAVVAHLLGHMLLHAQALVLCRAVHVASDARAVPSRHEEAEANAFSGALLMPEALLAEAVASWMGARPDPEAPVTRDDLVTAMAREFGTGTELAACRLITLGLLAA